jgi:hypothetical protein
VARESIDNGVLLKGRNDDLRKERKDGSVPALPRWEKERFEKKKGAERGEEKTRGEETVIL